MATKTEIANMALSHLGVGKEIANLDTDQSAEGSACRRFYEMVKDATLRDFNWPFATRFRVLSLIEESPNDEWDFSYRYPTDCLEVRRILSGQRNDTNDTRAPYKIAQDDAGLIIYTDEREAEIEYTVRADDPLLYPSDFIIALSFRLAFYIAPRLTAGDPFNLQQRCMQMYDIEISRAARTGINEEQQDVEPESELQRVRS